MRGCDAGHRCMLSFRSGAAGTERDSCLRVLSDFDEHMPVGAAELDAIEAFLSPQIMALLGQQEASDSEAPQCPATMRSTVAKGKRREVAAEEPR